MELVALRRKGAVFILVNPPCNSFLFESFFLFLFNVFSSVFPVFFSFSSLYFAFSGWFSPLVRAWACECLRCAVAPLTSEVLAPASAGCRRHRQMRSQPQQAQPSGRVGATQPLASLVLTFPHQRMRSRAAMRPAILVQRFVAVGGRGARVLHHDVKLKSLRV